MNEIPEVGSPMDGLGDRLEFIEEQPLASRAAEYAEVQEHLRARLAGADASR